SRPRGDPRVSGVAHRRNRVPWYHRRVALRPGRRSGHVIVSCDPRAPWRVRARDARRREQPMSEATFTPLRRTTTIRARLLLGFGAANAYLATHDSATGEAFRRFSWDAHDVQRQMNALPRQSADEIALIADIDTRLSDVEVRYNLAHRLLDLGRGPAAQLQAAAARPVVDTLLSQIDRLGRFKANKLVVASAQLRDDTDRRSLLLLAVVAVALGVAATITIRTVRSIDRPLRALVGHARQLSGGDLTARTTDPMPEEFQRLAEAMNHAGDSLSKVVSVTSGTAQQVAGSATELAEASTQISDAASQVASAMSDVTSGASNQVQQLRDIDGALQVIRQRADTVRGGVHDVKGLAHEIAESSTAKRPELER